MDVQDDKNDHWISPELRAEFTDQLRLTEIDSNGCDVKIVAVNEKVFYW